MPSSEDVPALPDLARRLLRTERHGVVSTGSAAHDGWPFGSVSPFAVARDGNLVFVWSNLAEHTRNVQRDPRASLFVQRHEGGDPQASARMAVLGTVVRSPEATLGDDRARYIARFPEADRYLRELDFHVYRLDAAHVRLVGGFARVARLPGSVVRPEPDPLEGVAPSAIEHMNQDHAAAMASMVRAFRGREGIVPTMTGLDAWGFDLEDAVSRERFRFDFPDEVHTADEVRRAMVTLTRAARESVPGQ